MATISTAQTILTALNEDLQLIKVAKDYLTEVGDSVFRGVYLWDELKNRPAITFWEDTITLIPPDRTLGVDNSQSNESMFVTIVAYVDVDEDYDTLHKVIKDIRKFLLSDDNSNLCYLEQENITISPHAGRKKAWAIFEIEFQYNITSTDP